MSLEEIQDNGWPLSQDVWNSLSEYEKKFAELELSGKKTPNYYLSRIKTLGLSKKPVILDIACGIGQWSIPFAMENEFVISNDINKDRLSVAKGFSHAYNQNNIEFLLSSMEKLPYKSLSCHAIFCYGAFMFADMRKTIMEFQRTLKPGGLLYLNANSWGWYMHLILDLGIKGKNLTLIKAAFSMIFNTIKNSDSQRVVSRSWLIRLLEDAGFTIISIGCEGTVSHPLSNQKPPESAYPMNFYHLPAIVEVLAIKRD